MRYLVALLIAIGLAGCGFAEMKEPVAGYTVDCSSGAKSAGRGYASCLANQPFPSKGFRFNFEDLFHFDRDTADAPPPPPE